MINKPEIHSRLRIIVGWIFNSGAVAAILLLFSYVHHLEKTRSEYERYSDYFLRSFESTDTPIIVLNDKARVEEWSNGSEKLLGYTKEEVKGSTIEFLMPPELRHRHRIRFEEWTNKRGIIGDNVVLRQVKCHAIRKDGTRISVLVHVRPYLATPRKIWALGIIYEQEQVKVFDLSEESAPEE